MLAMGRALMGSPRILLLDEPSLGLAPLIVKEIFAIIERLRARGRRDPARRAKCPRSSARRRLWSRHGNGRLRPARSSQGARRQCARDRNLSRRCKCRSRVGQTKGPLKGKPALYGTAVDAQRIVDDAVEQIGARFRNQQGEIGPVFAHDAPRCGHSRALVPAPGPGRARREAGPCRPP